MSEASATDVDLFGRAPKNKPDWSHRRGEPRVFAVLWMVYLMAASALMLGAIMSAQAVSPSIARPAAAAMIVTTAVGLCVLWPMVRLSQASPERPGAATLADLGVVLPPVFAITLPQALWFLASWPMVVVVALCAALTAWGVLVGGGLALVQAVAARAPWVRTGAMVVFVVGALGVPAVALSGHPRSLDTPTPGWMASPTTAVLELTRARHATGRAARVYPEHWRWIGATGALGAALWLAPTALGVGASGRRG